MTTDESFLNNFLITALNHFTRNRRLQGEPGNSVLTCTGRVDQYRDLRARQPTVAQCRVHLDKSHPGAGMRREGRGGREGTMGAGPKEEEDGR